MGHDSEEDEAHENVDAAGFEGSHLEACYVLHQSAASKPSRKKKRAFAPTERTLPLCLQDEPHSCARRRLASFEAIWKRIEAVVKDTLELQHLECFERLEQWISNMQYCKAQINLYAESPAITTKRLSSAILFPGSVDSSDSRSIYNCLVSYLKRKDRCHVARLQPEDFASKTGVNGPLRSLLKQFIGVTPETTDMGILAAWHQESSHNKFPMVLIVEDAEHIESVALAEVLSIISEWAADLPFFLVLGVATTGDSLSMMLPAILRGRLQLQSFIMKSPLERLEAVMQAVLIDLPYMFFLGQSVVKFFYEYFFTHDNTVTAFLRLLKVSCMEHFCRQPLSFLCEILVSSTSQVHLRNECSKLSGALLNYASSLPSAKSGNNVAESLCEALWSYKKQRHNWSMAFQCFLAAGKHLEYKFADIFYGLVSFSQDSLANEGHVLSQIIEKLRLLPVTTLSNIVNDWNDSTSHDSQYNEIAEALRLQISNNLSIDNENAKSAEKASYGSLSCGLSMMSRRRRSLLGLSSPGMTSEGSWSEPLASAAQQINRSPQKPNTTAACKATVARMAMEFLQNLLRDYALSPEMRPFNEIFCFKDVKVLKEALIGESRNVIHSDLLASQKKLKCTCCSPNGALSSSIHDTALAYTLSQEHNELINVHDWYQSFETIQCGNKSSISKSEKACSQARFSRAVAELHIAGLLRLPKKRHPDSVQRVGFGL